MQVQNNSVKLQSFEKRKEEVKGEKCSTVSKSCCNRLSLVGATLYLSPTFDLDGKLFLGTVGTEGRFPSQALPGCSKFLTDCVEAQRALRGRRLAGLCSVLRLWAAKSGNTIAA